MRGRTTNLPTATELAEDIQDGATVDQLASRFRVHHNTVARHLSRAGYSYITGLPITRQREATSGPPRLVDSSGGSGPHVGGGDNEHGVPTTPLVYRNDHKSKPTGLDWAAIHRRYIAAGGVQKRTRIAKRNA